MLPPREATTKLNKKTNPILFQDQGMFRPLDFNTIFKYNRYSCIQERKKEIKNLFDIRK
jgi:hypothetical protein